MDTREEMIVEAPPRRFGPPAAAFLAAGIGSLVLGLLTTLAAASESIASFLEFSKPVGPLSGKTTLTVALWLVAWVILHLIYRDRDPSPRAVFWATGFMVAAGLVMTFPVFFAAFAPPK